MDNKYICSIEENSPTHTTKYVPEICGDCKYVFEFNKHKFCRYTPPQVTLHQAIREQFGCLWCDNYTRHLDSKVCEKCMEENENGFEMGRANMEKAMQAWKDKHECIT